MKVVRLCSDRRELLILSLRCLLTLSISDLKSSSWILSLIKEMRLDMGTEG